MANPPKELLQPSWEPLDLSRIEPKPKQIIIDDLFVVQVLLNDRQERDYITIRGLIRTGGDLGLYYRGSITSDRLLKLLKVLHLHLGGPGSDAILYLIQYPEHVLFV